MGGWYFTIAIAVVVFLGQEEYFNLVRARGIFPAAKTTIFVSQALLVICNVNETLADAVMPISWDIDLFLFTVSAKNGHNC